MTHQHCPLPYTLQSSSSIAEEQKTKAERHVTVENKKLHLLVTVFGTHCTFRGCVGGRNQPFKDLFIQRNGQLADTHACVAGFHRYHQKAEY